MPTPNIAKLGYNPANFACWIGTGPWVAGYAVYYAISFYDARTQTESARSDWWGPKSDPKKLYGGFGLIRIPTDPTIVRAYDVTTSDNPVWVDVSVRAHPNGAYETGPVTHVVISSVDSSYRGYAALEML